MHLSMGTHQSINQPANQSNNELYNQSTSRPNNQATNWSISATQRLPKQFPQASDWDRFQGCLLGHHLPACSIVVVVCWLSSCSFLLAGSVLSWLLALSFGQHLPACSAFAVVVNFFMDISPASSALWWLVGSLNSRSMLCIGNVVLGRDSSNHHQYYY